MAENVNVSDGAQRALKNAMAAIEPYRDEPRLAALHTKLNAVLNPTDISGDSDAAVAKAMMDCEQIAKSETASRGVRDRAATASLELQRSYLAKHSLGSRAWEDSARAAGRVA